MYTATFNCMSSTAGNRPDINETSHIVLPEYVFNALLNNHQFSNNNTGTFFLIQNTKKGTEACASSRDFTSPANHIILPNWLYEYLECEENDPIKVTLSNFPNARSTILQPYDSFFDEIDGPSIVLSYILRDYFVLNEGATISFNYADRDYKLLILKTEPGRRVLTRNADIELDFARPIDSFKPHKWSLKDSDSSDEEPQAVKGNKINGEETEFTPEKRTTPIHTTFETREEDRIHGHTFQTTVIKDGEVLPPPKSKFEGYNTEKKFDFSLKAHDNPFLKPVDYFKGEFKKITKKKKSKKGKKESSENSDVNEKQQPHLETKEQKEETKKKENYFTGPSRKLSDPSSTSAQQNLAKNSTAPPPPKQQTEQEKEKKRNSFSGPARCINGSILSGTPQTEQYKAKSNQNTSSKANNFTGKPSKLNH